MRRWIEKQRNILDFTLSSLNRRKGRNFALGVVYTGMVFLLASVMFFTSSIRREASLVLQRSPDLVVQSMAAGRQEMISEQYRDAIARIKGVRDVRGRLWGYYFDPLVSANYTLMVTDEFGVKPGTVVIGQGISRSRSAYPGDVLPVKGYDGQFVFLTISKIFSPESELLSADLMLVSEEDFRALFRTPTGFYTDLVLTVTNSREVRTVAGKIMNRFPDTRPLSKSEILRTYENVLDWRSGIVVVILSAALLAFIIFAIDKASGLSAGEKKEIGILKAVGWETSDVLVMKFWEGTVISLSSFLLGVTLAYVHVFFTPVVLFAPVLKGWSTLYPEYRLLPAIDYGQTAALFFLTVMPYTVATIIPSWRAATIDPDAVIRS